MASGLASSAKRPIPLRARPDLKVTQIPYQRAISWVVKDPVSLRYYRFQPEQYKILELLDGERNLEQIRDEFHREFPAANLSLEEIQSLISDLYKSGLVYSNRLGQGAALIKLRREQMVKKFFSGLKNILYLRLPGWDPERTLNFIQPFFNWMFTPFGVAVWLLSVLSSLTLLGVQFETFQSKLPEFKQFFGWPNLMYLWVVLGASKIIHEFGHGLSCKQFGGECHEMGVMLLVFSPCLYCDVSDSWMLKSKWQRIIIAAAGMYIEILLSSVAIYCWWFTASGLFHHLCLNLFFVSTVSTVIFNANPLMRYDGYYMLSDWLEIPNLRPKADKLVRETFSWYCLGIESRPDPFMPQSGKGWFVLFAISAAIYRWVIMFAIILFFYTWLKPYGLQSIGIAMATTSVVSLVVSQIVTVYQIISAPRRDPMSTPKVTTTLSIVFVLLIAAMLIPFPWSLNSALVIEPHHVQHVYVTTPGRLTELHVKANDEVKKGQVLAKLVNFEKEQEYLKLKREADVQRIEIKTQHALQDDSAPAREKLANEKLETILAQMADYEMQLKKLTLIAPCDGTIVSPPRNERQKHDVSRTKLSKWHGTPLSKSNANAWLKLGAQMLSIAPDKHFQAVLLIDQADRNDTMKGGKVRIKLDELPDVTYLGVIEEIAERHSDYAPTPLSVKGGGEIPTTTTKDGKEKLQSKAYQATVKLEQDTKLIKPGFRGRAKFVVETRSVGAWLARYLRQTFHFRL